MVGGAERYVYELARHMAMRVPTSLVTFGARPREFREEDLRIRVIAPHHKVKGQETNPISRRIFAEVVSADVVHCHQQHILVSSVAAITARILGKRAFVTDLGGGGWDLSAYISTDRLYHAHLHISEYSRAVFGHAASKYAKVILGGVDTEKFSPAAGTARNGRILFVGRILPHKGLLDLVDAVGADLPLDIIGQPYDLDFLERLKSRMQGTNVRFHHDLDDASLVQAYQRCACIVLPSVYKADGYPYSPVPELLGQTLIEGMACGAPGVCTNVASLPEVVTDQVTGFVVPPNDPEALRARLSRLVHDPAEASRMGREARRRMLERFTWDAVVERCLEAYEVAAPRTSPIDRR